MGLAPETVEAIRRGAPDRPSERRAGSLRFADEFLRTHTASDAPLNAAPASWRRLVIVDLVGTMGLDQISSMMVALDKTPLPQGLKRYFKYRAATEIDVPPNVV